MKAWEYLASIEDHQERMKAIADVKKKVRQQMAGKSEAEIKVAWDDIMARMKQAVDDKLAVSQKEIEHKPNKFKWYIASTVVGVLLIGMLGTTIYAVGQMQNMKHSNISVEPQETVCIDNSDKIQGMSNMIEYLRQAYKDSSDEVQGLRNEVEAYDEERKQNAEDEIAKINLIIQLTESKFQRADLVLEAAKPFMLESDLGGMQYVKVAALLSKERELLMESGALKNLKNSVEVLKAIHGID